jgi:3-dehydroquinate dehydratase-2
LPKPIHILNGPNINLIGVREPAIYGATTLEQIGDRCAAIAQRSGYEIVLRQTNSEGGLVDHIQEAREKASAIIINAAAYTHTSVAVLDALKTVDLPIVECHISSPHRREAFRHHSYVSLAATAVVAGFGAASYEVALDGVLRLLSDRTAQSAAQA